MSKHSSVLEGGGRRGGGQGAGYRMSVVVGLYVHGVGLTLTLLRPKATHDVCEMCIRDRCITHSQIPGGGGGGGRGGGGVGGCGVRDAAKVQDTAMRFRRGCVEGLLQCS